MKKILALASILALALAGGIAYVICNGSVAGARTAERETKRAARHVNEKPATRNAHAVASRTRRIPAPKLEAQEFTPVEQADVDFIEDLMAEEKFEEVRRQARRLGGSTNAAVRARVVAALGWFGEKAIVDLAPYLADEDADVRDDALVQWNSAVGELEDEQEKANIVRLAMLALSDREMLDDVAFNLYDIEEETAVPVIKDIIANENASEAAIAAAKEAYEFVTGDEWDAQDEASPSNADADEGE